MSEIRENEVFMAGRIAEGPLRTSDKLVQFLFQGSHQQDPFHCVCDDKTAENLLRFCEAGDEISLEGELRWLDFPNSGKTLVIYVRYVSYGRKAGTLRQTPGER